MCACNICWNFVVLTHLWFYCLLKSLFRLKISATYEIHFYFNFSIANYIAFDIKLSYTTQNVGLKNNEGDNLNLSTVFSLLIIIINLMKPNYTRENVRLRNNETKNLDLTTIFFFISPLMIWLFFFTFYVRFIFSCSYFLLLLYSIFFKSYF